MKSNQATNTILLVMTGCLVVNTIVFALPVAYRAIKNEVAWIEVEKKKRLAEEEESKRLAEAYEMCTEERVFLFSEAIRSPGKEWTRETERKIRALPRSVGPSGFFRGYLNLWIARNYYQRNPDNVDLPLTVEGCHENWPNFPFYRQNSLPKPMEISKPPRDLEFACNSFGCDYGKPPVEFKSKSIPHLTLTPYFPLPAIPLPPPPSKMTPPKPDQVLPAGVLIEQDNPTLFRDSQS